MTELAGAARRGDLEDIDRLVAGGADVNQDANLKGWPPIIHAIHKGQREALARLLDRGASLQGQAGRRALEMASGYGDVETVRLLLSRGVILPRTDGAANSLMAAAIAGAWDIDYQWSGCQRHTEVVRALITHDPRLRAYLPPRPRNAPYSPASLAGGAAGVLARWSVRGRGCHELVRMMGG